MAKITTPEQAARLARTIVSDIVIYNKEKIKEAIKNDDVFEVLEDEITQGEEIYKTRVPEELQENHFNNSLVDILIKRSGNIESEIW